MRHYFIGKYLGDTYDVFEQARAILLYRFSIAFFFIFLLPLTADISLGYDKAVVLHGIDAATLLLFPFCFRAFRTLDQVVNFFFVIVYISSMFAFMILNPDRLDPIGMAWTAFFIFMSALLQRGKARIFYCCFLGWIPVTYCVINMQSKGRFTWHAIVQQGAENPPPFLLYIPMVLGVYAIWNHTQAIQKAKETIFEQKALIEDRNKDITDSIVYAKRIQDALLPPDKLIKQWLPESFILYQPKEIVAGDFYWIEAVSTSINTGEEPGADSKKITGFRTQDSKLILFAAADCTGHGVPGAMVSVLGHNALNRAAKEFNLKAPAEILDKVNLLVEETFAKSEQEMKDGMDISLCALDIKNQKLHFSGANNPLYIISNGKLTEIKGDKQPIGKFVNRHPFTEHTIDLRKGDLVYIFSDGYADQFGGPKGKKFKYSRLRELLLANHQQTMAQQRESLARAIDQWKGSYEQVDDICIIGIKV